MVLTAAQYRVLIVAETGDIGGIVAAQVGNASTAGPLWTAYDGKSLDLQYLYTKRSSYGILIGATAGSVDYDQSGVLRESLSQQAKAYADARDAVTAEIAIAERQRSASGAAVGVLTNTAPMPLPSPYGPNINDVRYLGDIYGTRRRYPRG